MKLRKTKPSGDPVDPESVVTTEEAVVPVAPPMEHPEAGHGEVVVELLTRDGHRDRRIVVRDVEAGFKLRVDGLEYRHVSSHEDGTWQYMV